MNKLLVGSLALLLGVLGVSALRHDAQSIRRATSKQERQWQSGTNALTDSQATAEALRAEVLDKKNRLRAAMNHPQISPELLRLMEGDESKGHAAAWAELRSQLGIGWNASPDYVLVSKAAIKDLQYQRLLSAKCVTDIASDLLGLSPAEQSGLASVIQRVRDGQSQQVQRTEPSGDMVAQYTALALDPTVAMSLSNSFAAGITGVVGPERADMLVSHAWWELSGELAPSEAETMTIRRSAVDGVPEYTCEMRRGSQINMTPVKFAYYPSQWFLSVFPGGWEDLAQREHFELPADFRSK